MREALDALGEGVTLADSTGRILYSNPAADRILGVEATDRDPEEWAEHYGVFDPGSGEAFAVDEYPLVRAVAGEASDDVEMLVRNPSVPDGVLISATGRPVIDAHGGLRGAVVVFRDVTAFRKVESALRRTLSDLEDLQKQKAELTGFLIHDMKGPLTAILAGTELVGATGNLSDDDREALEAVTESANILHRMVLDLLDIQTAEDGRLDPEVESVDLRTLLERAAGFAKARGARATVEVAGAPRITVDPDLLRRVLQNLVDNCLKYGPAGGRIHLLGEVGEDGLVLVRVTDEGPGVPPELREAIFERYAKLERDPGRRRAGSRGLGLRFCRVAVEAHGGRIWVSDHTPRGACFFVELPASFENPSNDS